MGPCVWMKGAQNTQETQGMGHALGGVPAVGRALGGLCQR